MRRLITAAVVVSAYLVWFSSVAHAAGEGQNGASASNTNGMPQTQVEVSSGSGAASGPAAPQGSSAPVSCQYFPPLPIVALALPPQVPQAGSTYKLHCVDTATGAIVVDQLVVYDPGVAPQVLVDSARRRAEAHLDPKAPSVGTNPAAGDQLVGVPTWLWVDGPWVPVTATATVGPVSSTVTAAPKEVRWDLGDGTTMVCDGPGARYDQSLAPEDQSSGCTHTYTERSTTAGPTAAYQVTATVTYEVTWTATTGQAGNLGTIDRSTTVPLVVREAQALIG